MTDSGRWPVYVADRCVFLLLFTSVTCGFRFLAMSELKWVVIDVVEDESFATVKNSDVVYEDPLQVGDKVKFWWNKQLYSGTVRFIDESSDACFAKADSLNEERSRSLRKEKSFHENEQRKAAKTCLINLPKKGQKRGLNYVNNNSGGRKKRKVNTVKGNMQALTQKRLMGEATKKKSSPLGKLLETVSDDSGTSQSSDDDFNDEESLADVSTKNRSPNLDLMVIDGNHNSTSLTGDDNQSELLKLAAKLASLDNKTITQLISVASNSPKCSADDDQRDAMQRVSSPQTIRSLNNSPQAMLPANLSTENPLTSSSRATSLASFSRSSAAVNSNRQEVAPGNEAEKSPLPQLPLSIQSTSGGRNGEEDLGGREPNVLQGYHHKYLYANPFQGVMFRANDPSMDRVEIGAGIFCDQKMFTLEENSISTTMAARQLLVGVYSDQALCECTITGLPPRGKGRNSYAKGANVRPFLDQKGISAIITCAFKMEKERYWRPKKSVKDLRTAMATKLCEIRALFKV